MAPAAVTAPNQNAAWKSNSWAMSPVIGYPSPAAAAAVTERVAMAAAERPAGRWLRAMAMVTGRSPSPTPWRPRPTTSTVNPLDTAESTQPITTTPRATTMTRLLRGPSARRPMAGVARAPVRRAAVSTHWAVLSETPSVAAMLGTRGAPRLLITATTAATSTKVGSSVPSPAHRSAAVSGGGSGSFAIRRTPMSSDNDIG